MAVEPLIYEFSRPGRRGVRFPAADVPETADSRRASSATSLDWPEVSEIDVIRHYTRAEPEKPRNRHQYVSARLLHDEIQPEDQRSRRALCRASLRFTRYQTRRTVQGALELMYELQDDARPRSPGSHAVTLQPAAGAHGELTGVLVARSYHRDRGDLARTKILVPDSAHGTNPATAAMAGFHVDHDSVRRSRQRRYRRAAQRGRPGHRGDDDHQSEHARSLGRTHRRSDRDRPRRRRSGLQRRRQLQRDPGHGAPRRSRHRHHALQPAQDLFHPARRRRSWLRSGRRPRRTGAVSARSARRKSRERTAMARLRLDQPEQIDRPSPRLPRQLRHARARLHLHPHARRRGPAPGQRRRGA